MKGKMKLSCLEYLLVKGQIEQLIQFGFDSLGRGDFARASKTLADAQEKLTSISKPSRQDRVQLAIVLTYLGKALAGMELADFGCDNKPSKAETSLLKAIKTARGSGENHRKDANAGEEHENADMDDDTFLPIELAARLFLGEFYLGKAYYAEALSQFEHSYTLAGLLEDLVSKELAAGQLGTVCLYMGKLEAGLDWFLLALELADKIERKSFAHLKSSRNLQADEPGQLDINTPEQEQDAAVMPLVVSNKSIWLGSLGLCSGELGQYDKAIDYYQRAYLEAELADDKTTMSVCLGSKGNCLFEMEEYCRAKESFLAARELAFASGDRRRSGIWQGNAGIASLRLKELQPARQALEEALSLAREEGDLRSVASHLDSLSEYYKECGEQTLAQSCLEEAIALSRKISDEPSQRIYLNHFGSLKVALGELAQAFEYFRQGIDLFDRQRAYITADDLKTSFANRGFSLYQEMIATCFGLGRREEALEYVGRAKSRALIDLLSNTPIDIVDIECADNLDLQALKKEEARLRSSITSLERLLLRDAQNFSFEEVEFKPKEDDLAPGDDTNSGAEAAASSQDVGNGHKHEHEYEPEPEPEHDYDAEGPRPGADATRRAPISQLDSHKLYEQWQEVVNQLKRRHPNYASLIATATMNYSEMEDLWRKQLLSCDTALLEFYYSSTFLFCAFLYQPDLDEAPLFITHYIDDKNSLAELDDDLSCFWEMSATEGWEVPLSLSKRLYKKLLGPVAESLAAQSALSRLVIVPHGALYHLPFAALHNGSRYLCQTLAVSYLPAISLIPLLQKNASPKAEVASACRYLVSAISDYSATRKSGQLFRSLLRSSAGLEDLSFTLEEAGSIVDFGKAHRSESTLLTNDEVRKGLVELFGEFEVVHFAGHAIFNPDEPMASGLVLSDGSILSAAAILEGNVLRTTRGRLLVLSACQTGVNRVTKGGEILGLARALMYAGMPNLVLSLWEVSDRSTAGLMQDFYSLWQDGKISVAQALRGAQERALAAKLPVHAWAPFIHFGLD
jgi:CHAT domain-containing protein